MVRTLWRRRGRPRWGLRYGVVGSRHGGRIDSRGGGKVNAYFAYLPTVGDVTQAATGDRQWVAAAQIGGLTCRKLHQSADATGS